MISASSHCSSDPRFVGDPIDVVTGAQIGSTVDLVQRGPLEFRWGRHYNSLRAGTLFSLGWGHAHDFERRLIRDLDGLRYEDPLGVTTFFDDIPVGATTSKSGMMLSRSGDDAYVVAQSGGPDQDFAFSANADVARLARLRDGLHKIEFRYAANGSLREIVDSLGRLIEVGADPAGRVLKLITIDPKTRAPGTVLLAYEYDTSGNVVRAADFYKTTQTFAYDARHRLIRRTDRRGYSFFFEYDDQNRCIHSRGEDGLLEVFLTYLPEAKMTRVRRGDGGRWIYFYSDSGAITQVTDPYGAATKYVQDGLGRTVKEIDPLGNITQFHYDADGQHDSLIDPNGHVLATRDADPNPADPLAYKLPQAPLQWEFGALLDAEVIQPPDAKDPLLALFPAPVVNTVLGKTTTYDAMAATPYHASADAQTDDFGRPVERVGPRCTEKWQYDPNGNLATHQDPDGAIYRNVYKSWNGLNQVIDPLGNVMAIEHTVQGQVAKITDPGGTVTEYIYDLKEKLVEVRHQGKTREQYRRDATGNLVEKRDSAGRTLVTWEMAPGNLQRLRVLGSGEMHAFTRDAKGRVTVAETPTGKATFTYDPAGRLLSDKRDDKGVVHELGGNLHVATTYFDKFRVAYGIADNGDRIVTDPAGGQHAFKFGRTGLVAKVLANGSRELCQFDIEGRCFRKAVVRPAQDAAPWMRSYSYSAAGDLIGVTDTKKGVTKYHYDVAHRLTEESSPGGAPRRFVYDAAGNLLQQPGLTKVAIERGNLLVEANGDRFTYNHRDNMSVRQGARGTIRYEYNDLDLLVHCDINGESWHATYDAYCRRVAKTWQGRTTTYYWDDFRLAAEVRHDGSLRLYIYADDVALVPFLFVEYADMDAPPESGRVYSVFTNQVGVPIRVEDAEGKPCWTARVGAYGGVEIGKNATLDVPLRFPGHYCDAETGLHYNRFRYFSPELGRYLQSDPLGQAGGINLHAYPVMPLVDVDIDGLTGQRARNAIPAGQVSRHVVPRSSLPPRTGPAAAAPAPAPAGLCPELPPGSVCPLALVQSGAIDLPADPHERAAFMADLNTMATTRTGQRVLGRIQYNHQTHQTSVTIRRGHPAQELPHGPVRRDFTHGTPGTPSNSSVQWSPGRNYSETLANGSPSDAVGLHELDHAGRAGDGNQLHNYPNPDQSRFPNTEEERATRTENDYRRERELPERRDTTGAENYYYPLP